MKKRTKVWLIIAASLVLLGSILFAGVMTTLKWDFMKLATDKYETNNYVITEVFDSISIDTDTADIVFALSDDGKCRVECHEEANQKHSVTVEDRALTIKLNDERTVYDFIGLNFDTPKIMVYLPETNYTSLLIDGSTGDICVENISVGSLELTVSTGKINVSNATSTGDIKISVSTGKANITNTQCKNVISSGNTGNVFLKNVIATEKISIKRSTGDVNLDACDAAELFIDTDTGDVLGTLLSEKVFLVKTDTGDIDVPNTVTGGKCEIITNTGDIKINIF